MEYARLGTSDLVVSRIAFGCEPLGGFDWGQVKISDAIEAVHVALDCGVNFFDTADVYGLGHSEEVLGKALGESRKNVIVATKFGVNWQRNPLGGRAQTFLDSRPTRVVEALDASLRRLRLDCIPLYQIHWPDPKTPIGDTLEVLQRCQEQGKIRYIGCSNFSPSMLHQTMRISDLVSVEVPYSLVDRRAENDMLSMCLKYNLAVLAYGVLGYGLLTGKYGRENKFGENDRRSRMAIFQKGSLVDNLPLVKALREVGERYGKTSAQVAIRWALDNPAVTCVITGVKSPIQVEENTKAVNWSLSKEDRDMLAQS